MVCPFVCQMLSCLLQLCQCTDRQTHTHTYSVIQYKSKKIWKLKRCNIEIFSDSKCFRYFWSTIFFSFDLERRCIYPSMLFLYIGLISMKPVCETWYRIALDKWCTFTSKFSNPLHSLTSPSLNNVLQIIFSFIRWRTPLCWCDSEFSLTFMPAARLFTASVWIEVKKSIWIHMNTT